MRIDGNTPAHFGPTPSHLGPTPQDKQNLQGLLSAVAQAHGDGASPTIQIAGLNTLDNEIIQLKGQGKINDVQFNQMSGKIFAMIGALQASKTDETTFGNGLTSLNQMISDL